MDNSIVPKDTVRLDSLKSISSLKRGSVREDLDQIEEDLIEDEETTPKSELKKGGSGLNLKAMGTQSTLV